VGLGGGPLVCGSSGTYRSTPGSTALKGDGGGDVATGDGGKLRLRGLDTVCVQH